MGDKRYYLYLESFVFAFKYGNKYLLYDSFLGKSFVIEVGGELESVLSELLDEKNMYSILLLEKRIEDKYVSAFIKAVKDNFLGDLVNTDLVPVKPVVFPPILDFQKKKANQELELNVLDNLKELVFYVNGFCEGGNCSEKCDLYFKQCLFCKKSNVNSYLEFGDLKRFLEMYPVSHLPIYIAGGNLNRYSYIDQLIDFLSVFENVNYCIHYKHYWMQIEKWKDLPCVILVDCDFDHSLLCSIFEFVVPLEKHPRFVFLVNDLEKFSSALFFQKEYMEENISVIPIFDDNFSFFEENIFVTQSDLENIKLKKKDIYRNKVLNSNLFGRLIIDNDGKIYTNVNDVSLGNIVDETLKSSVMKALKGNNSWFRIRTMSPCSECLYQWLCPPPSNYDYVMRRFNLCRLKGGVL